jgi:hypothetical protein
LQQEEREKEIADKYTISPGELENVVEGIEEFTKK